MRTIDELRDIIRETPEGGHIPVSTEELLAIIGDSHVCGKATMPEKSGRYSLHAEVAIWDEDKGDVEWFAGFEDNALLLLETDSLEEAQELGLSVGGILDGVVAMVELKAENAELRARIKQLEATAGQSLVEAAEHGKALADAGE